jgi:hypothetical protein
MRSMECEYNLLEHCHKHIGDCRIPNPLTSSAVDMVVRCHDFKKMEVMENLRVLVEGVGVRALRDLVRRKDMGVYNHYDLESLFCSCNQSYRYSSEWNPFSSIFHLV